MSELRSGRAFIGFALILLGIGALLHTTETLDMGNVARWLPSLLILLGVWQLVGSGFRSVPGPFILIIVGVAVQLLVLGLLTGDVIRQWWPVVLIGIGLAVILGRVLPGRREAPGAAENTLRLLTFLGDSEHRSTAPAFEGGQVTTLLGDTTVDLRNATPGARPARLDVFVLMGDTKVAVPEGWTVRNEITVLLGEVKDRRRGHDGSGDRPADLVLTGLVILGDATIQD